MQKKVSETVLSYDPKSVNPELKTMLGILGSEYPVSPKKNTGLKLEFEKGKDKNACTINLKNGVAKIQYGQVSLAARAVGTLLSGIVKNNSEITEKNPFDSFGIMLDCSRNAVMTVEHFKKWLRQLALMGYNMAMLYTEDTYEIEGERFFGFMRGAYTANELKEIDAYASDLGIEMIPCIQTLGHLEQILKWPAYMKVKDTTTVLLTNNDDAYKLIEKMMKTWLSCFKTRRIHIGMDEAHDMGRGKYMDLFGYKRGFEVFNEHLAKLVTMCKKFKFKPMIWSDMYFRMGCKSGGYYDKETVIPNDVKNKIPKEAELVYWDYYHNDKAFYDDWIERHRALGSEPLMGSGVWTWGYFWHNQSWTQNYAGPCIDSCREKGLKELFFTMWGDDGAYCDFDSAMSGLLWSAERAFNGSKASGAELEKRFKAICFGSYAAKTAVSDIYMDNLNTPRYIFWDDPLLNINLQGLISFYREQAKGKINPCGIIASQVSNLEKVYAKLKKSANDSEGGNIKHALTFIKFLSARLDFSGKLLAAYAKKDKKALGKLIKDIPVIIKLMTAFDKSFKEIWFSHNKPFGIESIQIRNAGTVRRFEEIAARLSGFINGQEKSIPELDIVLESMDSMIGKTNSKPDEFLKYPLLYNYRNIATSSFIL